MTNTITNLSEELVRKNSRLNEKEFAERRVTLESYPRLVFVQMDAPCNQDCLFCSRPRSYGYFSLDEFRDKFGSKLEEAFNRAERLLLTGSGELLFLPEAKKNLSYFNSFSSSEKMFATNGSSLTPKMLDFLIESGNRYTIHVSIHASNGGLHRVMTNSGTYDALMYNLRHLRDVKGKRDNLTVNFIFLMTSKNAGDLPKFVDFAGEYGADGVIAYYNYVYKRDQRELSCFFAKDEANRSIDAVNEKIKKEGLKLKVSLPPKFGEEKYDGSQVCGEAWSQIMINPQGDIITCDVAGDSKETLTDKSFMDVWNGEYFTDIRKRLAAGDRPCSKYCFRANPSCVNDLRSHLITRGKSEEEIESFIKG